jgi:hypothetical protein
LKPRLFKAVFSKEKIMKRFVLVALGACLAAAPFVRADEWSKTYTLTGKPDLRVETSDANIRVDTWGQNTISAQVTSEGWKIGEGGQGKTIRPGTPSNWKCVCPMRSA